MKKNKKITSTLRVRYIKEFKEYIKKEDYKFMPKKIRGIYALLNYKKNNYNVVYIGMSCVNIKGRIERHSKSKSKKDLWSHFSIFEVNDNIYDEEIKELEGLFRMIYRKDEKANLLNKQGKFKGFRRLRIKTWEKQD